MDDEDLFYPEMDVSLGPYSFSEGIEVEVYSSASSYFDWAKVRFTGQFQDQVQFQRRDTAQIELGYNDNLNPVFQGYVVHPYSQGASVDEVVLKDDMLLLEETLITKTFLDATPQDILNFCLAKAGISEAKISSKLFPKKATIPIYQKSVIAVIETIHAIWKNKEPFFFSAGVFYWGIALEQDQIYEFEYGENIISLSRTGGLWELETVSAPFIRHSHTIAVVHPKVTGSFMVKKVIFTTEETGFIRTRIYF